MTPIPNGSTPSAEPHDDETIEQTTGAAVGGVSARIPPDIFADVYRIAAMHSGLEPEDAGGLVRAIASYVMSAKDEQREADARIADEHAQILRQNFDRSSAIAVEGVAAEIRKGA